MRRARELAARAYWRAHPGRPGDAHAVLLASGRRSRDELRALQADALRELLRACLAVPFHRERLEAAGVSPDGAARGLDGLPPLDRSDVQRLGVAGLCVPGARGFRIPTSGSTGQPLEILRPLEMTGWIDACDRRAREWSGAYRHGQRTLLVRHTVPRGQAATRHGLRNRIALALANETALDGRAAADPSALRRLAGSLERRPAALVRGLSNTLYLAALALEREGLAIRAGSCWSGGNHLPGHYRARLEEAFACPVYERYGAWEAGAIAHQCPEARAFHVAAESVLVEIVRDDGTRAAPGEVGHVLVTPLRNRAMPLLRYRIGDLAEAPAEEGCPCGRPLPLLGRLIGRANELLRAAGGRSLPPEEVSNQMRRAGRSVLDFQVTQRPDLTLDVKVVQRDDPAPEPYRRRIAAALDELVGLDGATRVERVEQVPLTGAGKLRHIVSEADGAP